MGEFGKKIAGADKEVIEGLKKAYADEWVAHYLYRVMAQVAKGWHSARLAEVLTGISKEELEHADELATRLAELEEEPVTHIDLLNKTATCKFKNIPKNRKDWESFAKLAVSAEQCAIAVYEKLAKKVHGKDLITYNLLVHILEEEVKHEEKFQNLL